MNLFQKILPFRYLVTPNPSNSNDLEQFLEQLEKSLIDGICLVQLRAKNISTEKYRELAIKAMDCCKKYNAVLVLNAGHQLVEEINADGIHLDGARLTTYEYRPVPADKLVSAACHSLEQIKKAEILGADMVTLSPVLPTESHPGGETLGWEKFSFIARKTHLPVYALGGMNKQLLRNAQENGAYGIAGIRSFWST